MNPVTRDDVQTTYRRYAPFYDRVFGRVLEAGRRLMCEQVRALDPASILEVGVGTGLALPGYPARARVVGIDLSDEMLAVARQRAAGMSGRQIELRAMDAERMEFPDGAFDCVTVPYVLSVTPDPARLAAELRRVCRPGGDILILNHFSGSAFWRIPEAIVGSLADRIGFRSRFPLAPHIDHPDWTLRSVRPANLMGLSKLIHLENTPAKAG